ncbi:MAG: IMP-specific 5'-nucleotidase-domain-containing protein [Monoraphidium minutum]|nr:MAG: IMP-specific 5'-nucleotidase-domain-containing protein [Monoraphidium minutum]
MLSIMGLQPGPRVGARARAQRSEAATRAEGRRERRFRARTSAPMHWFCTNGAIWRGCAAAAAADGPAGDYWDLLLHPDSAESLLPRAKSASDASLLRRKGHLKEQDKLIEYIRHMHETHTCEEAMFKIERWIADHRRDPRRSRLKRIVPTVGSFFTPLRLVDAFREYDAFFHLSRRRYIPPNFAELRHVLNIAQVHASTEALRLITFDADGTLYADGAHIQQDSEMIRLVVSMMRLGVHVAIVTAAGYPGDASKFEGRIEGLLSAFRRLKLPPSVAGRFHLMGGECNYLLRVNTTTYGLEFVPDEEWQTSEMRAWREDDIRATLDEAQSLLSEGASRLMMPVSVIRKTRSVGVVPRGQTIYEVLEDLAITVQQQLITNLPFCAFNGGNDVFVDIGNKSIGLDALMRYLGAGPTEVLHVGDRFTDSGNDAATRDVCSIVWVANPEETAFFIRMLLADLRARRSARYIE